MDKTTCRITGLFKVRPFLEAVNWVCDDALDEHVWVSELATSCQEAKVLDALQWGMLWLSAPPTLDNALLNERYDGMESG